MVRVYKVSPDKAPREKQRLAAAIITVCIALPVSVGLIALYFHLDPRSLSAHDYVSVVLGLGLPCAALWLCTVKLGSIRIELDDERITRTQNHTLWGSPVQISLNRREVGQIREVGKNGLMVRGLGPRGRYVDLHIPRFVENYDDLKSELAAWQPVISSWV